MKNFKIALVGLVIASFISCSSNDDTEDCYNCDANLAVPLAIQYCDNEDGTMDVTTSVLTETIDIPNGDFEDFIAGVKLVTSCSQN